MKIRQIQKAIFPRQLALTTYLYAKIAILKSVKKQVFTAVNRVLIRLIMNESRRKFVFTIRSNHSKIEIMKEYKMEEKLLGMELINGVLRVRVQSGGCTKKEHFIIETYEAGIHSGPPFRVVIYRIEPDNCTESVPEGLVVEFKFEQMITEDGYFPQKGDGIIVENIFVVGD